MKNIRRVSQTTFLISLLAFIIPASLMSQQKGVDFKVEVKKNVFLQSKCLLYLPEDYNKNKDKYPLLLFLHGSGERGDWLELLKKNGPPMMIELGRDFPMIVVTPQCPEEQEEWSVEVLDMLLNEMVRRYRVNEECIFVTGLSMGGTGTWNLAFAYPDRFAAIVPICGYADQAQAEKIKDLPVWVFHGAKDDVVPPQQAIDMVNTLKALGSPVKFTLYPEANHDSWTDAYNDQELWDWMLGLCH
jgi:predicted peptidase